MNRNGALYVNAALLALTLPILVRLLYEALYLRLLYGPQMLGFGIFHGATGPVFGTILVLSAFCCYPFVIASAATALLFLVPAFRRRFFGVREIPLMLVAFLSFVILSEVLQLASHPFLLLLAALGLIASFLFLLVAVAATVRLAVRHE